MADAELDVFLGDVFVGHLREHGHRVSFSFADEYIEALERPVLGQWFEDRLHESPLRERHGGLVPFFGNLLPAARLAREAGANAARALEIMDHTFVDLRSAWRDVQDRSSLLPAHRRTLAEHWQAVPLLRRMGSLPG